MAIILCLFSNVLIVCGWGTCLSAVSIGVPGFFIGIGQVLGWFRLRSSVWRVSIMYAVKVLITAAGNMGGVCSIDVLDRVEF